MPPPEIHLLRPKMLLQVKWSNFLNIFQGSRRMTRQNVPNVMKIACELTMERCQITLHIK